MCGYLLIYKIDDYPDNGGGTYWKRCDTKEALMDWANKLLDEHGKEFSVEFAGWYNKEYKLKAVERVTKMEIED